MFRAERDPADLAPGAASIASAISSWRRACRSSCGAAFPTTSCSALASRGKLQRPGGARAAGAADAAPTRGPRRWSATSRASGCTCAICGTSCPSKDEFPDFDDNLRQAFQRETELLVESIMREDRSVLDLLTADYTFVNERLAQALRHPERLRQPVPPRAGHRRRAPGPARARQHSTVTSQPNRTSPVLRGKWILDNLLGTPPPPPPPDVPPLKDERRTASEPLTMREQMEEHRANAGVRDVPQADGPPRLRAGELRRDRRLAHRRRRRPIDRLGAARRRHARWTAPSRCGRRCCAIRTRSSAR